MKLKEYASTMFIGFNVSMYKNKVQNNANLCKYRQLTIAATSRGFLDDSQLTSYDGEVDSKYLTQIGDIIYICLGGNTKVYTLKRFTNDNWSFEEFILSIKSLVLNSGEYFSEKTFELSFPNRFFISASSML